MDTKVGFICEKLLWLYAYAYTYLKIKTLKRSRDWYNIHATKVRRQAKKCYS